MGKNTISMAIFNSYVSLPVMICSGNISWDLPIYQQECLEPTWAKKHVFVGWNLRSTQTGLCHHPSFYMLLFNGWASEILHQLIDGKHPMFFRFQPSKVMQDFATIHSITATFCIHPVSRILSCTFHCLNPVIQHVLHVWWHRCGKTKSYPLMIQLSVLVITSSYIHIYPWYIHNMALS